jgi:O-methyltransferase
MATAQALLQRIALSTPFARWLWPPYRYMFTPSQLAFLGRKLETAPIGTALEIGCANGDTTVWLSLWMEAVGVSRRYVAIDTFTGFRDEDIAVEAERGRDPRRYMNSFRGPTRKRFEHAMSVNGIDRVEVVTADSTRLDYAQFAPIAFALVDVDLYRPVRLTLDRLYPLLIEGGTIVVDDCASGPFEGALEAYRDFCREQDLPLRVEHGKLGLITR